MNYATYETYSTPSRDERVFDDLVALRMAYHDILVDAKTTNLARQTVNQMEKVFPYPKSKIRDEALKMASQNITPDSICVIEYAQGRKMDMAEMKRRLFLGLLSNNPHDDLQYRWGDLKGPSPLARRCQSWDPWKPNLNQDPL